VVQFSGSVLYFVTVPPAFTAGALLIEGHQGLISPILTRDHEWRINYGIICSIYPARFAVFGAAVALLTHDHGLQGLGPSRALGQGQFSTGRHAFTGLLAWDDMTDLDADERVD
jgi:hypothetical protein